MWLLLLSASLWAWPIQGDSEGLPQKIDVNEWFIPSDSSWAASAITLDPLQLASAAAYTLEYIHNHPEDTRGVQPGMLSEIGIDLEDVKATLAIIAFAGLHYPGVLSDPNWWSSWFDYYEWRGDAHPRVQAHDNQIRLTRYVIYSVQGSSTKTEQFPQALWQTPFEELSLSEAEAQRSCPQKLRCQLTRQDILAGALEKTYSGQAHPLMWVSEYHFHEAQLQGTIVVRDEAGDSFWFNVHRPNPYPYVKGLPPTQQKRYWFFQPTDGAYGWGSGGDKIALFPGVSMAGDVDNLGLGKVFWIQSQELTTVGILSDTGGAFQPNLQQLDWFMGVYPDRQTLDERTKDLPRYAKVGILIRKEGMGQP